MGRVTKDPAMQQGRNNGTEYISLDLATSQKSQNAQNNPENPYESVFYQCFLNKHLAERLAEGIHYLMRLSSNDYKAERKQMRSGDGNIILKHTSSRLQKIRKNHPERYAHMKKKGETWVRISRSALPSGNELSLMTNLPDRVASEELADLYYQRWEIISAFLKKYFFHFVLHNL